MNILVVDDAEEGRYMLEVLLTANGHDVTGAANGREALERLQSGRFDLIISDILMPVMDGFELCRRVRKDEGLRDIPFIVYTATYTGPEDETLALNIGADRFIQKPCDPEALLEAIEQVMAANGGCHMGPLSAPKPEEEILKLYNERLVRKLELSKRELEAEVRARRKAAEAAKAAAKNWQITFDAMLDPVALLETDGVVRQCNQAFADFVGASAAAVVGEKCFERVHQTKEHIEGCPLLRSLQSNERETMPMTVGSDEFLVVTDPVKGPNGEITGLVHIMRNITELKQVQEALLKEKEFADTAINSLPGMFYLFDEEGRFLRWNTNFRVVSGYSNEEISRMHPVDFFMDEEKEEVGRAIQQVFEEGESSVEACFVSKDGTKNPCLFTGRLFISDDQSYLAGMGIDISERKQAEESLRKSEEKYRAILENMTEGYHEVDVKGNFTFFNKAFQKIMGYSHEELMGMNYKQYAADQANRDRVFEAYNHVFRTGEPLYSFEWDIVRKDGIRRMIEVSVSLITGQDNSKLGFRGILRDVTERRQAEEEQAKLKEQLQQAQKMESVGRLAGGVAHDFNNMLTIILGYGENLLAQLPEDDPLRGNVLRILEAGKRSAALTQQLLAFSRKQVISPRVLDLNDTVEDMLKMVRRLIGEDIDLAWSPGHELWRVNMDPTQVDQILANLTLNARDAIAGVGKATIRTENVVFDAAYCADHAGAVPGDHVMLSVSDDGCGMDQETLDHLFEPFFTTKEVGKGTGMGLPTVYGIVKQNNGFITVESEPGKGTTVAVYLPRFGGEADEEEEEKGGTDELPRGRGEMILLVEDEAALLEMGKTILEHFGYRVLTANAPEEAIRLAQEQEEEIHLLMTDVVMPQMNGQDLARKLREIRPKLPCLFMSGYTSDIIAKRGMLEKDVHFIQKPFMLKELAEKVRKSIDSEEGREKKEK